jgi:uncharacterized protein with HEPN domain
MSRDDAARLRDILGSVTAIRQHLERGDITDGLVFDAVRMRLIEIGEAAKDISPQLLAQADEVPWREVAGMRDWLAHRYFDTAFSVVEATVQTDLAPIESAAHTLLGSLCEESGEASGTSGGTCESTPTMDALQQTQ